MNRTGLAFVRGVFSCAVLCSGCASVMSGRHADVTINSYPSEADLVVRNQRGQTVATGVTPAQVSLKRGNGFFRRPPRYTATLEKPGYQTAEIPIRPRLNPWLLGNVGIGGIVGLAADTATGAAWRLTPDEINYELAAVPKSLYSKFETDDLLQASYASDEEEAKR